jgi:hypothetical protein
MLYVSLYYNNQNGKETRRGVGFGEEGIRWGGVGEESVTTIFIVLA